MMGFVTDDDLKKLEQKNIDLILIMEGKLAGKIDKLSEDFDRKFQSLELGLAAFQATLDKLHGFFIKGQENRHNEIMSICAKLNDHDKRLNEHDDKLKSLERK